MPLIATQFDSDFNYECNLILSKIAHNDDTRRQFIIQELEYSSNQKFRSYSVSGKLIFQPFEFLDKKRVGVIKKSHNEFLKDEYYMILRYLSDKNEFLSSYDIFIDILNDQINKDASRFDDLISQAKSFYEKQSQIKDVLLASTNYEIRQKEKVKEIKVQISFSGDLKDEIDQDF